MHCVCILHDSVPPQAGLPPKPVKNPFLRFRSVRRSLPTAPIRHHTAGDPGHDQGPASHGASARRRGALEDAGCQAKGFADMCRSPHR